MKIFDDILSSFESTLYRVLIHVILIPKTLFLIFARPHKIVGYVNAEFQKEEKARFDEYSSPVAVILLLSVLLNKQTMFFIDTLIGNIGLLQLTFPERVFSTTLYLLIFPMFFSFFFQVFLKGKIASSSLKIVLYKISYFYAGAQFFSAVLGFIVGWNIDIEDPLLTTYLYILIVATLVIAWIGIFIFVKTETNMNFLKSFLISLLVFASGQFLFYVFLKVVSWSIAFSIT